MTNINELAETLYHIRDDKTSEPCLWTNLEQWVKDMYYQEAERLIKCGYRKQTLVELDGNVVAGDPTEIAKFGRRVVTKAEIYNLLMNKFAEAREKGLTNLYIHGDSADYVADCICDFVNGGKG